MNPNNPSSIPVFSGDDQELSCLLAGHEPLRFPPGSVQPEAVPPIKDSVRGSVQSAVVKLEGVPTLRDDDQGVGEVYVL